MTMSLADWFSLTAPAMDAPAYFYITQGTFMSLHHTQHFIIHSKTSMAKPVCQTSAGADFMQNPVWVYHPDNWKRF